MDSHTQDTINVGALNEAMHERGYGILLAIAALPLCIPIPAPPGYTTLFSIPLFLLSIQLIAGRPSPWIPKWLARKNIPRTKVAALVEKATPALRRVERLLRNRYAFAATTAGEKIIGFFTFLFSLSIAVPLPMTNVPPAWGVLLMALAKDGIVIGFGILLGSCGVAFTVALLYIGPKLVLSLFGMS